MSENQTVISLAAWHTDFHPLLNREGQPRLFHPHGDDLRSAAEAPVEHVWTCLATPDQKNKIISGFHPEQGVGFYLTFVPRSPALAAVLVE